MGGFHRSHQAWYTDALIRATAAIDWGICGIGLLESDRSIGEILTQQDTLYTLTERRADGQRTHRVIGSLVDFMLAGDNPAAVINRIAHADTKIVSLTITIAGYNFDSSTQSFDFSNPDVKQDLDNPSQPITVFGYLAAALRKRRDSSQPPFTVQSCDNIEHNGDTLRTALVAFVERGDSELADWIANNVCFPNSMVDRITPMTEPDDISYLNTTFGLKDDAPVTCEPYAQWIIEDRFPEGRPNWEAVGAQFVDDVAPFEKMKIRLLNAGHWLLAVLGSMHGHQTIDDCVRDPLFATFLRRFMDLEATPLLDSLEGVDLEEYKDSLIERFGNPYIKDSLSRLRFESSTKAQKFLLPTLRENLERDGSIECATLVMATWCLSCHRKSDRHGADLEYVDKIERDLAQAASNSREDSLSFLRLTSVFGNLAKNERFAEEYANKVDELFQNPDVSVLMQRIATNED